MTMKNIIMLGTLLVVATLAGAQVVETTTYDDGRVYTGQRSGKGKIEGKGLMTWNLNSTSSLPLAKSLSKSTKN